MVGCLVPPLCSNPKKDGRVWECIRKMYWVNTWYYIPYILFTLLQWGYSNLIHTNITLGYYLKESWACLRLCNKNSLSDESLSSSKDEDISQILDRQTTNHVSALQTWKCTLQLVTIPCLWYLQWRLLRTGSACIGEWISFINQHRMSASHK